MPMPRACSLPLEPSGTCLPPALLQLVGVICKSDVRRGGATVGDAMTATVVAVKESDAIPAAAALMLQVCVCARACVQFVCSCGRGVSWQCPLTGSQRRSMQAPSRSRRSAIQVLADRPRPPSRRPPSPCPHRRTTWTACLLSTARVAAWASSRAPTCFGRW